MGQGTDRGDPDFTAQAGHLPRCLPYFAAHFGLQLVGFVERSPGQEPSPQELTDLVNQIKAQNVPVVFAEPQFNPKLADTLAREAGIKTAILYSDTPPEGQGYLEKMRSNVQNIVEGLC